MGEKWNGLEMSELLFSPTGCNEIVPNWDDMNENLMTTDENKL